MGPLSPSDKFQAIHKVPWKGGTWVCIVQCADWSCLEASEDYLNLLLHTGLAESLNLSLGSNSSIESHLVQGREECGLSGRVAGLPPTPIGLVTLVCRFLQMKMLCDLSVLMLAQQAG